VPPRKVNPAILRDLETICLKAMAREPDRRYASARALADDLRHFRNGEPILARPPRLAERAARWLKRDGRLIAGALLAVGLSVVVGSVVYVASSRPADAPATVVPATVV